ncbi:MAG: hypothetical protein ABL933_04110 [Methyloglobulus sp.]|nr:hypothetical protein [Methyloglobulus sp.]
MFKIAAAPFDFARQCSLSEELVLRRAEVVEGKLKGNLTEPFRYSLTIFYCWRSGFRLIIFNRLMVRNGFL